MSNLEIIEHEFTSRQEIHLEQIYSYGFEYGSALGADQNHMLQCVICQLGIAMRLTHSWLCPKTLTSIG